MKGHERSSIQIVCADECLAREYLNGLETAGKSCRLWAAASLSEARKQSLDAVRAVVLFDESAAQPAESENSFESSIAVLSENAPVIVVAVPERLPDLTFLITSGTVDFVERLGNFVPVAAGLVERRLLQVGGSPALQDGEAARDFSEILRHEVNNPLTGILGNAEMLLARRDRLPPGAIERLETITELAVRLRETVRRLSGSRDVRHDHVGSA